MWTYSKCSEAFCLHFSYPPTLRKMDWSTQKLGAPLVKIIFTDNVTAVHWLHGKSELKTPKRTMRSSLSTLNIDINRCLMCTRWRAIAARRWVGSEDVTSFCTVCNDVTSLPWNVVIYRLAGFFDCCIETENYKKLFLKQNFRLFLCESPFTLTT